ncbi:hypothetical protein KKH59_04475 [Patescibacteria group bacterium]|nr:hypothetical protein [Patescibacteria group bacterium]
MNNYYIKNIWGPGGQKGYPHKDKTEFAEGQKRAAERFSECDGFFLYETGGKENDKIGAKTIFAQGTVQLPPEVITNQDGQKHGIERGEEKEFPYDVKINLSVRIHPRDGVPLDTIRKILKSPKEKMQRPGGLIKITKEQFDQLFIELNKRPQKS